MYIVSLFFFRAELFLLTEDSFRSNAYNIICEMDKLQGPKEYVDEVCMYPFEDKGKTSFRLDIRWIFTCSFPYVHQQQLGTVNIVINHIFDISIAL